MSAEIPDDMLTRLFALEGQWSERQELTHRFINTLQFVTALIQRVHVAPSLAEFERSLVGRLQCMAATYSLAAAPTPVTLPDLVEAQLERVGLDDRRFAVEGDALALDLHAALRLGLAIHELASNARIHGAWRESGQIRVSWSVRDEEGTPDLALCWEEPAGLCAALPAAHGFGLDYLLRILPYELDARCAIDRAGAALRFTMSVPVARIEPRTRSASG